MFLVYTFCGYSPLVIFTKEIEMSIYQKGSTPELINLLEFLNRIDRRMEIPPGYILLRDLACLWYLAKGEILEVNYRDLVGNSSVPLYSYYNGMSLTTEARDRLSKGKIPENWFELFQEGINRNEAEIIPLSSL